MNKALVGGGDLSLTGLTAASTTLDVIAYLLAAQPAATLVAAELEAQAVAIVPSLVLARLLTDPVPTTLSDGPNMALT